MFLLLYAFVFSCSFYLPDRDRRHCLPLGLHQKRHLCHSSLLSRLGHRPLGPYRRVPLLDFKPFTIFVTTNRLISFDLTNKTKVGNKGGGGLGHVITWGVKLTFSDFRNRLLRYLLLRGRFVVFFFLVGNRFS